MATMDQINRFLEKKHIAVIGASAARNKFGNGIVKELYSKGYNVYPVHPNAEKIEGLKCYPHSSQLPDEVTAAVIAVARDKCMTAVQTAAERGIRSIWIIQTADSPEAIEYCRQNNIDVIYGQCILMFVEPMHWIHKFHRFFHKAFGKMPA